MQTCVDKIISKDLETCLTTMLWMRDQQSDKSYIRTNDFNIKFEELSIEMEFELKGWFNSMIALINDLVPPKTFQYKMDIGKRLGCMPVSMDQNGMHFIFDYYDS